MPQLDITPKVKKFIQTLPPKHRRQIKDAILSLQKTPLPHDVKKLHGYSAYLRIDCGEYRIIYRYEPENDLITVVLAGKRNGDEIYRVARRNLK